MPFVSSAARLRRTATARKYARGTVRVPYRPVSAGHGGGSSGSGRRGNVQRRAARPRLRLTEVRQGYRTVRYLLLPARLGDTALWGRPQGSGCSLDAANERNQGVRARVCTEPHGCGSVTSINRDLDGFRWLKLCYVRVPVE